MIYPHMPAMWGAGFMGLGLALFWLLVVVGAVMVGRELLRPNRSGPPAPPPSRPVGARGPVDLLRDRFARGEIDEAEFRQRLTVLDENDSARSAAGPSGTDGS